MPTTGEEFLFIGPIIGDMFLIASSYFLSLSLLYMASFSSIFNSIAILGLILANVFAIFPYRSQATRVDDEVASYHVVSSVHSFLPTDVCNTQESISPSTLTLSHRHGPCSPLKPKRKPTHTQLLNADQLRVDWLHSKKTSSSPKSSNSLSESKIPARRGNSLNTGDYIVTIRFGTPAVAQSVIFDTGSDVTWIQCRPCVGSCYTQQDPLFTPTSSSTYANISCSSTSCAALDVSGCSGSTCVYEVQYGDNSQTIGFFAQDTLTLTSTDIIPNFQFGCGENNQGHFGLVAGLMGLGREQVSLVSQTTQKYGGVFSYCLPAAVSSTGYLTFGNSPASNVQFTPMLTDSSMPTFYFLELISISVAGQTLSISPTLFSNAGVVIDSGTVITRLPPTAYAALRSAFRQRMIQYPTAPALGIFDTCYDFSKSEKITVPTIALNFRGVTANLDFSGIIYVVSVSQACLGFAPNGDDSDLVIIGNTQQRKFNVVYDNSKGVIGFGPGGC